MQVYVDLRALAVRDVEDGVQMALGIAIDIGWIDAADNRGAFVQCRFHQVRGAGMTGSGLLRKA